MAILAGDALLSFAFEHIARETHDVPPERVIKVCHPSKYSSEAWKIVYHRTLYILELQTPLSLLGLSTVCDFCNHVMLQLLLNRQALFALCIL